jgi:hypothetical protein
MLFSGVHGHNGEHGSLALTEPIMSDFHLVCYFGVVRKPTIRLSHFWIKAHDAERFTSILVIVSIDPSATASWPFIVERITCNQLIE